MHAPAHVLRRDVLTLRRTLFAALVAGATGLGAGAALGFAAADLAPDPGSALAPPPATFQVAWPHLEDRGLYTRAVLQRFDDGFDVVEAERDHLAFEWAADRVLRDDGGQVVRAYELNFTSHVDRPDGAAAQPEHRLYAATDGRIIAQANGCRIEIGAGGETLLQRLLPGANESRDSRADCVSYTHADRGWGDYVNWLPCGLRNRLQESPLDLSVPVPLGRACVFQEWSHPDCLQFQAVGLDRLGDRDAVLFESVGHAVARGPVGCDPRSPPKEYAWYAADVPYPLRFAVEDGHNPNRLTVFTLQSFARGTTPLGDPAALPAAPELPPLEFKPREPWGPHDADVEHPFKLSRAYALARDNPNESRMREFLAEHPQAFASRADYKEEVEDNGSRIRREWAFTLQDGGAFLSVRVEQRVEPLQDAAPFWWLLPTLPPRQTSYGYDYDGRVSAPPIDPARVPPTMPTVRSLFERWSRWTGLELNEGPANAWEFLLEGDGYGNLTFLTAAGRDEQRSTMEGMVPLLPTNETRAWTLSLLAVDGRGRAERTVAAHSAWQRLLGDNSTPPAPPPPAQELETLSLPTGGASRWLLPSGAYAAGAGLVAIIAGLAYWSWPLLKNGLAAPLFSRLERPRALDHPARSAILAAVQAEPGLHYQEIVRRTGLAQGTAQHHLRKLVGVGLLVEHAGPGYTCYFPPGAVDRRVMAVAPRIKSAGARGVLHRLQERPGLSESELAAALGRSRQTIHHHVRRLEGLGLVRVERRGARLHLTTTELGASAS